MDEDDRNLLRDLRILDLTCTIEPEGILPMWNKTDGGR